MEHRIDKQRLLDTVALWNRFLKKKVRLVACGGTALTLLDIKSSTKDVDFLVPIETEYDYLLGMLKDLGYTPKSGNGWGKAGDPFIFDLYPGKRIHTTELLDSPLDEGRHISLKEYPYVKISILNFYDLIISKLFRASSVDFEDTIMLYRAKNNEIDLNKLEERFKETAGYDIAQERMLTHWDTFKKKLKQEKLA